MYYINGRYYDPSIGICINASNIDEIIDNAFVINGLDRQAITIDNILSNSPYEACILTYEQYYPDSTYYESEGKSWWEINWVKVVKTIIAITFLVVAIVLTAIPVTHCVGLTMLSLGAKASVSGFLWGGVVGGLIASIQGSNVLEGSINGAIEGLIDGFIDGAILGLISGAAHISGNCFKKGTLVLTEDGHKKIEDIKVGDKVYAYSEKTNEKSLKRVVRLFRNKTKKWIHIFIDDQEIICTGEHPFYIKDKGWVNAESLIEKEEVVLYNGNTNIISKIEIEYLEIEETTYNFEVEDYHTYYVSDVDVLVHNRCGEKAFEETINYDDLLPNEKSAYDGYSKNGWKGNYKGQAKGTGAGGKWDNKFDQLPNNATYKKYDINPPTPGIGRDGTRFIVGSDGKIYLTRDHYKSFLRILK